MERTRGAEERRWWRLTLVLLGLVYLSLWPLQFALDFLRARNLLRASLALLFLAAAGAVVASLARRRAGRREWLTLALVAAVYAALASSLEIVQERLHLLEYGLVALGFRRALAARAAAGEAAGGRWRPALTAAGLTALAGLVDELLQGVLPNRHYDLRDVGLNALSGVVALAAESALGWARRSASP